MAVIINSGFVLNVWWSFFVNGDHYRDFLDFEALDWFTYISRARKHGSDPLMRYEISYGRFPAKLSCLRQRSLNLSSYSIRFLVSACILFPALFLIRTPIRSGLRCSCSNLGNIKYSALHLTAFCRSSVRFVKQ